MPHLGVGPIRNDRALLSLVIPTAAEGRVRNLLFDRRATNLSRESANSRLKEGCGHGCDREEKVWIAERARNHSFKIPAQAKLGLGSLKSGARSSLGGPPAPWLYAPPDKGDWHPARQLDHPALCGTCCALFLPARRWF